MRFSQRPRRPIRCSKGIHCDKQHYFPHDANYCRADKDLEKIEKTTGIIVDAIPPRSSSPKPIPDKIPQKYTR